MMRRRASSRIVLADTSLRLYGALRGRWRRWKRPARHWAWQRAPSTPRPASSCRRVIALLLYTDGLSEAGPSRLEMLGTEGLARLLEQLPADTAVQAQAEALVGEVSAYARGVFRDDVAVLLARRL